RCLSDWSSDVCSSDLVALCAFAMQGKSDTVDKLADDFWTWRARYAPFTGDDVNRMERPGGMRDWSRASIDKRRKDLTDFETRWKIGRASWRESVEMGR